VLNLGPKNNTRCLHVMMCLARRWCDLASRNPKFGWNSRSSPLATMIASVAEILRAGAPHTHVRRLKRWHVRAGRGHRALLAETSCTGANAGPSRQNFNLIPAGQICDLDKEKVYLNSELVEV
jgi:hypothetical protein